MSAPAIAQFFEALNAKGITSQQNFTCCQTCGCAEIGEHQGPDDFGYCFYHSQDTERAAVDGRVYLSYGVNDPDTTDKTPDDVSRTIVDTAREFGLDVDWNGSQRTRIALVNLDTEYFAEQLGSDYDDAEEEDEDGEGEGDGNSDEEEQASSDVDSESLKSAASTPPQSPMAKMVVTNVEAMEADEAKVQLGAGPILSEVVVVQQH